MVKDAASLPEDPAELRATAADLIELVTSQALQIETLKHALAGHRRHRFGARSETLEQLELALEEAEIGVASRRTPPRAVRHPGRRRGRSASRSPTACRATSRCSPRGTPAVSAAAP